jgi:hypothetical protein
VQTYQMRHDGCHSAGEPGKALDLVYLDSVCDRQRLIFDELFSRSYPVDRIKKSLMHWVRQEIQGDAQALSASRQPCVLSSPL